MEDNLNLHNSLSRYFLKISSFIRSKSNRLSLIYILLIIINILQFLYVRNIFPSLLNNSDLTDSSTNSQSAYKSQSEQYNCISFLGSSKTVSSEFPGTCIKNTNLNGFSILYLLFIIDGAFNIFTLVISQCNKRSKIIQFFNRSYQKTTYNTLENALQFLIIYFGDDKLTLLSAILLFIKNILTIQYTFDRGRILQFIILLSGSIANAQMRKWEVYLVAAIGLALIEIFISIKVSLTHYEFIDQYSEEDLPRTGGVCCMIHNQPRLSHKDEEDYTSNINQKSSKKFSVNKMRSESSKKRIDQIENPMISLNQNQKGNLVEGSSNWEKNKMKNEFNQQFLTQLNKNTNTKSGKKCNMGKSQSMKHDLQKKSSLDSMISRNKNLPKLNDKDNQNFDITNQYSHIAINRGDQTNSFSSIYDKNYKTKNAMFIRYKTTSPGLKNDGTISIDQSKSRHPFVSSAGLIPSGGTYTIQSGVSLPKSHQKIGKKPALNLSDIKGLKFSEKFKLLNSKTLSKQKISSINSRRKIDLDEIGSQNGKRSYIYPSQNIQLKQKLQFSPRDIEPSDSLVSPNNKGIFQEDIKNQFSTKNFQNSSSKLLNQLQEIGSNANFSYQNNNYDHKNLIHASQSILTERPGIIMSATIKGRQEEEQNQNKYDSIDSENDFTLNNHSNNNSHLKDFYGMFFQILSEGIVLFNFENGDININNTLKRLLNSYNEKECIEILFSLKNASLQPLHHSTEGAKSTYYQNGNEEGVGQTSNNPEINPFNSSFMNINSYMYDNSLFTASKNKTAEEQTTSNNQKVPTQKSQKSINIHSTYTYNNQITNSNNLNDDIFSQIKRRHSTSSYNKTNTLMSRKTTRFQYKKDDEELNSSAEVENSPVYQQTKIKINSGIVSSHIIGVQFQTEGAVSSALQSNLGIRDIDNPLKTVKLNSKTTQAQKKPDSGLYLEESLNYDHIGSNNIFDRQQFQQQYQQILQSNNDNQNELGQKEDDEAKLKRKDLLGSGITATASPGQQQTHHQSHHSNQQQQQQQNKPFQKIIYSIAKEFTVKDQFEKIEEDMQDYANESRYEMLGHHLKMLCKLDNKNQANQNRQNFDSQPTSGGVPNSNTPTPTGLIQNANQQGNYYNSSMSYNQISSLNPLQHQNSMYLEGFKNRKASRFSNLSALNVFQQQSTVQFIQQQMQQQQQQQFQQQNQQQQQQNKNDEKKIIEITFIPCYVNKQKCLVLIVKDVSHFNSIKVLKEMNENRSKMLNYVVHEIRSPLNSIMNYLNSSEDSLTRELYNQFIDPALSSAQMLNVLIQDLLDMAQMKAGKYRLNIRPFRIENLIEDVKKTMRVIVKSKSQDITLESFIDPQITFDINSDQLRIKQILINLIGNAIKFTEEGSIRIEVTMVQNHILKISVRDTGIGITDDQKKKLFSEFSKIETTQTDILNPKGVGLGLVISNTLAKSLAPKHMQAGLELSSGKQKGSEFFFHIQDFQTQNNNTILHGNSSFAPTSEQNNILTKTNKFNTNTQQTKLNNPSFLNNASFILATQTSPQSKNIGVQQYQTLQTTTQLINSLFPYSKGSSNQDVIIDQDQLMLDQEISNNNKNAWNQHNSSSSSPSSNSSSSPTSRKHSVSIPIGEEDIDICIQTIAPKFRKNKKDQSSQQYQQQLMQARYLSSSVAGSDYIKNADMSLQNNSLNNNNNINNNYSFIQNSLSREPNKNQSINQSIQQNQQNIPQSQVASSYFNFDDNAQQGTPSLPINSVQSLRFGFQSLQHNSQASSSLQQDGLLNIPANNMEYKHKQKKKCNCSNILVVDDEPFQCNSLQQLIHSITKQSCDKATSSEVCMKNINQKYQQNLCCPTYQLIFLDLNMFPSKDGFETLIEIQKFHSSFKIQMPKVIACTGEADEEKKHQCLIAGFNEILEKPIQPDYLKLILQTYFQQNTVQQQQQQFFFQNTMSQLSFNQQLQVVNM